MRQPGFERRRYGIGSRRFETDVWFVAQLELLGAGKALVGASRTLREPEYQAFARQHDLRSRFDQRAIVSGEELRIGVDRASEQRIFLLQYLPVACELVIIARLTLRQRDV